jgi:hypothetical protein
MFNDVSISLVTSIKRDFLLNINLLENFMKKLLLASLALVAISAQAGTTATMFDVTATTTATCVAGVAPSTPAVAFGAYPAFSASAVASLSGFTATVDCTRSMTSAPVASFDAFAGTKLATGQGIVAGLNYSLTATAAAVVPGAEPTATAGAHNGTPDTYGFTVSGSIPAGQAGSATASGTQARTLTITF